MNGLQVEGQAQVKAWRQEQLWELKIQESMWLTLMRGESGKQAPRPTKL